MLQPTRHGGSFWPAVLMFLAVPLFAGLGSCGGEAAQELSTSAADLGRPPAEASINGWTLQSQVERGSERGVLRATAAFDDGGAGGFRSGGTCLVADLGLGACETDKDCLDAAAANGLPGNGGTAGWWHYCVGAGTGFGARDSATRCWTRPAMQSALCALGPGAAPGSARTVQKNVTVLGLEDAPRAWTALSCLAGGTDRQGNVVGDPAGCRSQTKGKYVYAVDRPIVVPGN